MRNFNKLSPDELYWNDEDKEWKYKDITYWCQRYWVFGVVIALWKEIKHAGE